MVVANEVSVETVEVRAFGAVARVSTVSCAAAELLGIGESIVLISLREMEFIARSVATGSANGTVRPVLETAATVAIGWTEKGLRKD
jgi:hypothetical protein